MYQTIIDAETVFEHLNNPRWLFFDVRFSLVDKSKGRTDFTESHIPAAQYVHLDNDLSGNIVPGETGRHPLPKEDDFIELLRSRGVSDDTQIVVYDDSHGGIAARLWWMLQCLGHKSVAVLDGGWNRWTDLKMPITDEIRIAKRGNIRKYPSDFSSANADIVLRSQNDPGYRLIDARGEKRYLGIEENIDPIAGHIHGAVNKPFLKNLSEQNFWKEKTEIEDDWTSCLAKNDDLVETIIYCGSGVTACHNILACTYAGLNPPTLYPGSWSDWITDPSRL